MHIANAGSSVDETDAGIWLRMFFSYRIIGQKIFTESQKYLGSHHQEKVYRKYRCVSDFEYQISPVFQDSKKQGKEDMTSPVWTV